MVYTSVAVLDAFEGNTSAVDKRRRGNNAKAPHIVVAPPPSAVVRKHLLLAELVYFVEVAGMVDRIVADKNVAAVVVWTVAPDVVEQDAVAQDAVAQDVAKFDIAALVDELAAVEGRKTVAFVAEVFLKQKIRKYNILFISIIMFTCLHIHRGTRLSTPTPLPTYLVYNYSRLNHNIIERLFIFLSLSCSGLKFPYNTPPPSAPPSSTHTLEAYVSAFKAVSLRNIKGWQDWK